MDFINLSTRLSPFSLFDHVYNTLKDSMKASSGSACPTIHTSAVCRLGKSHCVFEYSRSWPRVERRLLHCVIIKPDVNSVYDCSFFATYAMSAQFVWIYFHDIVGQDSSRI